MPEWTQEQQEVIQSDNRALLVSAAAGSGKTAVLVERIMRLLQNGGSLDRMMIVTYTNAAAAQLRDRILKRLLTLSSEGKAWAMIQADGISGAHIGTIHHLCGELLRTYFHAAEIDPLSRHLDEAQSKALFSTALDEAMTDGCEREEVDILALFSCFSEKEIIRMSEALYRFILSMAEPFEWLHSQAEAVYTMDSIDAHPLSKAVCEGLAIRLSGLLSQTNAFSARAAKEPQLAPSWQPVFAGDAQAAQALLSAVEAGLTTLASIEAPVRPKKKTVKGLPPEAEGIQTELSEAREAWSRDYNALLKEAQMDLSLAIEDLNSIQPVLRGLYALLKDAHERFSAEKRSRAVLDFSDLLQLSLHMLRDERTRETIARSVDILFVDEYQDVGGAEEGILMRLHDGGNRLFLVGDVKQSIYRFRLADPTLFLSKERSFSEEAGANSRIIRLNRNFRSAPELLDSVNTVFSHIMHAAVTEIDYDERARLIAGKPEASGADIMLHLIRKAEAIANEESEETEASKALEAPRSRDIDLLIYLIREQLEKDLLTAEGGTRKTRLRDIAVLLPKAKGVADQIAEALAQSGIPALADGDDMYFDMPEIAQMMALLKALDNPYLDIPLLSALKLPRLRLSDALLTQIRLLNKSKGVPFYKAVEAACALDEPWAEPVREAMGLLNAWRFLAANKPLDEAVRILMRESGLYYTAGLLKNGEMRRANLRLLCNRARAYMETGLGDLHGFIQLGEEMRRVGDAQSARPLPPGEDRVRILTIHKSKGLEFPIVFLMHMDTGLHSRAADGLRMHKDLGVGLAYIHPQLRIKRSTLLAKAIALTEKREEKAEKARLLYVGMTRAEQRLYLLGSYDDRAVKRWGVKGDYGIYTANSYLDWLCQSAFSHAEGLQEGNQQAFAFFPTGYQQVSNPFPIRVWEDIPQWPVEKKQPLSTILSSLPTLSTEAWHTETKARFLKACAPLPPRMPLKTSVSALVKGDPYAQSEETTGTKAQSAYSVPPLRMHDIQRSPTFFSGARDPAALGIAAHTVMARFDPALPLEPQLKHMAHIGLISEDAYRELPREWITGFMQSELCTRAFSSVQYQREWAFNLRLSPERRTLLQGVIDLCFIENDRWVLVDFKSDAAKSPEAAEKLLTERYAQQVLLYSDALERITERSVSEVWLYSLRYCKGIPLTRDRK